MTVDPASGPPWTPAAARGALGAARAPRLGLGDGACRLGFGCSGLMARLDRGQSLRLLDAAFDGGITHFDVARSYGYGEAERVVGEFLAGAGRRGKVTVATKVGILPPRRSPLLALARAAARRVAALHPGLRRRLRQRAHAMLRPGAFDPPGVRQSVETSLRELRAERVDLLLLHDCGLQDLQHPDLVALLDRLRDDGKIGAWGIATDASVVFEALERRVELSAVQFASGAWDRRATRLPAGHDGIVLTHSALGPRFAELCRRLAADEAVARTWSDRLGVDARDRDSLAALFLGLAVRDNPEGPVLFSSSRPGAIRSNAARVGAVSDDALDALASLAADEARAVPFSPPGVRA